QVRLCRMYTARRRLLDLYLARKVCSSVFIRLELYSNLGAETRWNRSMSLIFSLRNTLMRVLPADCFKPISRRPQTFQYALTS
ncbi:unnamed protein product, partial [Mycena citricolor]